MGTGNRIYITVFGHLTVVLAFLVLNSCSNSSGGLTKTVVRISVVNAPSDIVTAGAFFLSEGIRKQSTNRIETRVFHSGVLSGGKGETEIEMCQQGAIEMHITSTAYLANLVPKTSIISLPFLFRDMHQVMTLLHSNSNTLDSINAELNTKNLHIIAWWPRGFRQLTNNKLPIKRMEDIRGLKLRVMNNPLYADNMRAMKANPIPMAWGEVYNALQLNTIDGQENAEDVIYNSRLYEAQKYMTIWDYSIDFEIVMVNLAWWKGIGPGERSLILKVASDSMIFEEQLLEKNTTELREKIAAEGVMITYLTRDEKNKFRSAVAPVWRKYEKVFGASFMNSFLAELENY